MENELSNDSTNDRMSTKMLKKLGTDFRAVTKHCLDAFPLAASVPLSFYVLWLHYLFILEM